MARLSAAFCACGPLSIAALIALCGGGNVGCEGVDHQAQEVTPTSTDDGLGGLDQTPGVASAISTAGSAPPAPTEFMLHRVLNKKAKELKLAMRVSLLEQIIADMRACSPSADLMVEAGITSPESPESVMTFDLRGSTLGDLLLCAEV